METRNAPYLIMVGRSGLASIVLLRKVANLVGEIAGRVGQLTAHPESTWMYHAHTADVSTELSALLPNPLLTEDTDEGVQKDDIPRWGRLNYSSLGSIAGAGILP